MYNINGPPKGFNTTSDQSSYDLVFKDIIVKSENRNVLKYPNPNNYTINLGEEITKIYKAEIISVNVPAATDISVNIPSYGNRLYFYYDNKSGYIKIQAGTYVSPTSVGEELQRQFNNIVGIDTITTYYNINLNRYVFIAPTGKTLKIYPINGTTIDSLIVQDSIVDSLKLILPQKSANIDNYFETKSINIITNSEGLLNVVNANIYGNYGGNDITTDKQFENTILSDLVLTNYSIYLSLGVLNSNTIKFVSNENPLLKSNISTFFCEIPNNTIVGSPFNKTLLNEPAVWSGMNFYNPPLASITKMDVSWYNEYGTLINNICDQSFTIRIYYFEKRLQTTAFSTKIFNYAASGTIDSIFESR
jgi:hypothetical protein